MDQQEPHPFVPLTGLTLPVGITLLPLAVANQPWYGGKKPRGIYERPLLFPGLSFAVVIHRHGFFARVIHAFGMDTRLIRILQLQRLTALYVGWDVYDPPSGLHVFPHNRLYDHSIPAAIMEVVKQYLLGKGEFEMMIAAMVGLIHDNEIPAGGDAMKALDPSIANLDLFDEDKMVGNSFQRYPERVALLMQDFCLPGTMVDTVTEAVQGHGVYGMLHKIADTTSYLMCDYAQMLRFHRTTSTALYEHHDRIHALATDRAFRAWESIGTTGGVPTLGDVTGTHELIELHLRLWRDLYNHTGHKVLEHLQTSILYPWLLKIGAMSAKDLAYWHDGDLYRRVAQVFDREDLGRRLDCLGRMPHRLRFETRAQALHTESNISSRGHFTLLVEPSRYPLVSVRTRKFMVPGPSGTAVTFAEAYPEEAAKIEEVAAEAKAVTHFELVVFPEPQLTLEIAKAWQHARRGWHA